MTDFKPCTLKDAALMVGELHHELLCTLDEDTFSDEAEEFCVIAMSHLTQAKMFFQLADRRS